MLKLVTALTVAAGVAAAAGCSEYLDRRDTLLLGAGEAVQTNIVTQAVDPWPRVAADRNLAFSGERMAGAVRRYNCGPAQAQSGPAGGGGGSASVTIIQGNQAPAAPPPPC